MAHQLHLSLDDQSAVLLAALAERAHADEDDLAVSLLANALADAEQGPSDMTSVLDRVPGAWERFQVGREQARRGDAVDLDEL